MKPETRDIAGRIAGVAFFSAFASQRIILHIGRPENRLTDHLHFIIVTTTFLVIAASYIFRSRARVVAKGFMETIFPFIPAALPLAVGNAEWLAYTPWFPHRPYFPASPKWNAFWTPSQVGDMTAVFWTVAGIAANAFVVWSLVSLRRAFSIMVEARVLVTAGPYGIIRHPVYAGEILATTAMVGEWPSPGAMVFFGLFVAMQVVRSVIEERKLRNVFLEYEDYILNTGMFFPRLKKGKSIRG